MRNTVDIMGIAVDNVTMDDALLKAKEFIKEDKLHIIYTPNAEIMMEAHRDPELRCILSEADLLVADGAGVILASKILGVPLPERVAGFDLTKNILSMSHDIDIKLFIFGGKPGIAEEAAANIIHDYPRVEIKGFRNGYYTKEEEESIINEINTSGSNILLVALGAPKQEKWIHYMKDMLNVNLCIGVGGSIDVFAGKVQRAPEFFQRNSLEWLYRLYKEPRRFKRMMDLPRYILLALKEKLVKTRR